MQPINRVEQSFKRALTSYNDCANVQKKIADDLVGYLSEAGAPAAFDRIFEFGCGTGFFTQQLLEQHSTETLLANDLVSECEPYINKLAKNLNIDYRFLAGNIEQLRLPDRCDLICSASCVQWVEDLPTLISTITGRLNTDGWLAISSFGPQHFHELTTLAACKETKSLKYQTAQQWQALLSSHYNIHVLQQTKQTLWFDSTRELLLHLRATGVNGNAGQGWNQQKLVEFGQEYQSRFSIDGKLPLSYEPIYIIAQTK